MQREACPEDDTRQRSNATRRRLRHTTRSNFFFRLRTNKSKYELREQTQKCKGVYGLEDKESESSEERRFFL